MISCNFCKLAGVLFSVCLHARQREPPASSEVMDKPWHRVTLLGEQRKNYRESWSRCLSFFQHLQHTQQGIDDADRYSFCKEQPWVNKGVTASLSLRFTVLALLQGHYTSIPTSASPCVLHRSTLWSVWEKYSTGWFISATPSCKYT